LVQEKLDAPADASVAWHKWLSKADFAQDGAPVIELILQPRDLGDPRLDGFVGDDFGDGLLECGCGPARCALWIFNSGRAACRSSSASSRRLRATLSSAPAPPEANLTAWASFAVSTAAVAPS